MYSRREFIRTTATAAIAAVSNPDSNICNKTRLIVDYGIVEGVVDETLHAI